MEERRKEIIIDRLREHGCRITKQRRILLDIILEEDCSCCKEIYYKASKRDKNIGAATVYRMVNTLEEIGVINRKNMYRIDDASKPVSGCGLAGEPGDSRKDGHCCSDACREKCSEAISLVQTLDETSDILYHSVYTIEFDDRSRLDLSRDQWLEVIAAGLAACGYEKKKIRSVEV